MMNERNSSGIVNGFSLTKQGIFWQKLSKRECTCRVENKKAASSIKLWKPNNWPLCRLSNMLEIWNNCFIIKYFSLPNSVTVDFYSTLFGSFFFFVITGKKSATRNFLCLNNCFVLLQNKFQTRIKKGNWNFSISIDSTTHEFRNWKLKFSLWVIKTVFLFSKKQIPGSAKILFEICIYCTRAHKWQTVIMPLLQSSMKSRSRHMIPEKWFFFPM